MFEDLKRQLFVGSSVGAKASRYSMLSTRLSQVLFPSQKPLRIIWSDPVGASEQSIVVIESFHRGP